MTNSSGNVNSLVIGNYNNILFYYTNNVPTDKPLESIYGNLPYIAPEVIVGKESTFASDIYSFAGVPPEYNKLMKQCWDVDPLKRPEIDTLNNEILKMWRDSYNDNTNEFTNLECDDSSQISQTNPSFNLHSLSTKEVFHSKPYDFNIPDDIDEINNSLKDQDELRHSIDIEDITRV
ncbi:hypothetical protein C1645_822555 [Glomus cerebriforme]|uniref:Protein kinase domain-containing protein n=1 Tax=Glomus cerebriforme TaxID=658196 RepID=A0A397SZP6_9GLOM|nr:hypothetical protein C1645_822555 [Glomus cerebriforme]